MIRSKTSYDAVIKALTVDTPSTLYIPELQRYAEVVFTADKLYIADHSQGEKMWHPIDRDALNPAPLSIPASQGLHSKMSMRSLSPASQSNQTPPPPYTVDSYWPIEQAVMPQEPAAIVFKDTPPSTGHAKDIVEQPPVNEHEKSTSVNIAGGENSVIPATTKPMNAVFKKLVRVDPETGARVDPTTPGAMPKSTYYHRQLVSPITGLRVKEGTPGAITKQDFYLRTRFNLKKVQPAADDATIGISRHALRMRETVDRFTGKRVEQDSPNAVSRSVYMHSRPVNPATGEFVAADFPDAITINTYRKREAKKKNDA